MDEASSSVIPVSFAIILAANKSPLTLTAVRKRSMNQSMAMMTANIPVSGMLTLARIMTVSTRDDEGIGVVPMDARVDRRQIIT